MLFQVTWTRRDSGASEEADQRIDALMGKFTPPENLTIHTWVDRVDGAGGFALIEADDPAALLSPLLLAPYFEFQLYPVVQHDQYMNALADATAFRQGVS
jgi:hypothetical protein